MEWECVNGNLFSRAGHSDKNGATIGMSEIIGKLDDAGIARGIDNHIGSRFSNDLSDFFGESAAFCGRVESVSEAPLFGHGELGIVEVDADDGMAADHLSGLGDIQPDSTDSENNDTLADFELGIIVDDANSRCDGTSEEWRTAEVEFGRNHGEAILRNNGFVIKCGDPTCINGLFAPTVFWCLALQSTTWTPVKNDMVPRLHAGHPLPYPLYDARALVAEKVGKKFIWALGSFDLVDLRAANAAVMNADMDLAEGE